MLFVKRNQNTIPTLSNVFEDFLSSDFEKYFSPKTNSPLVNIFENENNFTLELAIPGFSKDEIELEVKEKVLTIASKKEEKEEEEKNEKREEKYTRKEFYKSAFKRSFELPKNIDKNAVEANYTNGILSITLPKLEPKPEVVQQINIR